MYRGADHPSIVIITIDRHPSHLIITQTYLRMLCGVESFGTSLPQLSDTTTREGIPTKPNQHSNQRSNTEAVPQVTTIIIYIIFASKCPEESAFFLLLRSMPT